MEARETWVCVPAETGALPHPFHLLQQTSSGNDPARRRIILAGHIKTWKEEKYIDIVVVKQGTPTYLAETDLQTFTPYALCIGPVKEKKKMHILT